MTSYPSLTTRWSELSLLEQLANIGSEVERSLRWRSIGNEAYSMRAFTRALELVDLTIHGLSDASGLREICRMRELLVDCFAGSNLHQSSRKSWSAYFQPFTYAARLRTGA